MYLHKCFKLHFSLKHSWWMLAKYLNHIKIKIKPNMFVSQHSSCPPVIFAITPNVSQEGCDFHHSDETISLSPHLKGRFLLVLSHSPLPPVKISSMFWSPWASAMWDQHCLCHYSINRVILLLTVHYLKGHVCGIRQTFLLLRAAIHKYPRQPERTAAHFTTRAQKQAAFCSNRRN